MGIKNIDTSTWEAVEWIDLHPGPGCYKGERKEYEIHGIKVQANNWMHAEFIWALTVCGEAGYDTLTQCAHCGTRIRFVTIFKDANGLHYPVGENCADGIQANWTQASWREKRTLRNIKKAKNDRYYLTVDVPAWYWDVPRKNRPSWCSASKYQGPGMREPKWYLTIWGDDAGDVVKYWFELPLLKPIAEAARKLKEAEAAAQAALEISYAEALRIQKAGQKIGLQASTKKTPDGYRAVLKDAKGKIVWEGTKTHRNRDYDASHTAAKPDALRELRTRIKAQTVEQAKAA